MLDSNILSWIADPMAMIQEKLNSMLQGVIDKVAFVVQSVQDTIDSIVCNVQSMIDSILSVVNKVKGIVDSVGKAKEIIDTWQKGSEIFVTTANKSMNKSDLKKYEYSGSLFRIKTNMKGFIQKKYILNRSLLK